MHIEVIMVNPLMVNCTILTDDNNNALIFDPGGDANLLIEYCDKNGITPVAILNTHGHFDHIGAVDPLMKRYNIPFKMHQADAFLVQMASDIAESYGLPPVTVPEITEYLETDTTIEFGGDTIDIIATPGHTPGGVCFYIPSLKTVITGDTLFFESVGRTDFPYSDHKTMVDAIRSKLFQLPEKTEVIPGHANNSSIGHEKKYNPFVRA